MCKKNNLLKDLYPQLYDEIDVEKNVEDGITFENSTYGSNKKIWWKCNNGENHSYMTTPKSRVRQSSGCPYCVGRLVLKGFNDMWSANPKLASLLTNPDDGYEYTEFSKKKLDWDCVNCNFTIEQRAIDSINKQGLSCPLCSQSTSLPERVVTHLLRELGVVFDLQKSFEWLGTRKYDFYIPEYNAIIETHGSHHYREKNWANSKSLQEIQEIDRIKKATAIENKINYYIEIDCSESSLDKIKENIDNHLVMQDLFNITDEHWESVAVLTSNKTMLKCWTLWESGIKSKAEIAKILNINKNMTLKYLKHGKIAKRCSYTENYNKEKSDV